MRSIHFRVLAINELQWGRALSSAEMRSIHFRVLAINELQ